MILPQLLGYVAGARGHYVTTGTLDQIADLVEDWFTNGAADGFDLMPRLFPPQFDIFAAEAVPLLQRRGLFAPNTPARCFASTTASPAEQWF